MFKISRRNISRSSKDAEEKGRKLVTYLNYISFLLQKWFNIHTVLGPLWVDTRHRNNVHFRLGDCTRGSPWHLVKCIFLQTIIVASQYT